MIKNGIKPIDLVVVNLYPFQETIKNPKSTEEDAIENIDIGGPAMLRSSAKNHISVTVVVDSYRDHDIYSYFAYLYFYSKYGKKWKKAI